MPGTLPNTSAPFGSNKRDIIEAADVPRQAQLQRLAQVASLSPSLLAASSTRMAPDPLDIGAGDLPDR